MVERRAAAAKPRVQYALTEKGRALMPLIDDMRDFGRDWLADA